MITAEMARVEITTGLSAVCAWCEHWHNGKEGRAESSCGKDCGGPASLRAFPCYKGPMNIASICFLCGDDSDGNATFYGGVLGVCNRMGPKGETCLDKLRAILEKQCVVATERVVPKIGG